ncbi:MAG TPA: ABC transporter permease subunit [Steroidobacteraceae bacterium]|nr:ABC transporter permease subunit [Steroidobacteraceae bacterium]
MSEAPRDGLIVRAARTLRRDARVRFALIALGVLLLLAIAGPLASPYSFDRLDWKHIAESPGWVACHWLGTDRLGRDLYVRALAGIRVSLAIGLTATLVSSLIGIGWGATAGYLGGRTDALMMRFVDVLNSLPYLFLIIALTMLFGRGNPYALFAAVGAVGWISMARIVRGQALSLRQREYIEAAVTSGAGTAHILARHIVPNLLGPVVVYAALTVPQMVLFESFLSFLGLGVQEPLASLGSLIRDGAQEMESAPWMLLVPASVLLVILAAFNLVGEALRDALDPREGGA